MATISAAIDNLHIDAIITDPPYRMDYSGGGCFADTTVRVRSRIASLISFDPKTIAFYTTLDIASVYIFCSKDQIRDYMELFAGWSFTPLCWCKTNPIPLCASSHLPDVEYLLFFSRPGRVWNRGLKPVSVYSRYYVSPKEEGKREAGDVHPTIKPLRLIENKLRISTAPDGVVLDPFGGSGTTLIAAEHTGRRCIMLERDMDYCHAIIARWEKETKLKARELM